MYRFISMEELSPQVGQVDPAAPAATWRAGTTQPDEILLGRNFSHREMVV